MTWQNQAAATAPADDERRLDLLLWRHAEAEYGFPDHTRKLTKRGEQQARQMAAWLIKHAPKNLRIVVSPATRCQQTASALGLPFETDPRLSTNGNASDLLSVAGWPVGTADEVPSLASARSTRDAVLIVGHQPTLGRTAARLLSGAETEWSIKKGALWWLSCRQRYERTENVLRAALLPEHLENTLER